MKPRPRQRDKNTGFVSHLHMRTQDVLYEAMGYVGLAHERDLTAYVRLGRWMAKMMVIDLQRPLSELRFHGAPIVRDTGLRGRTIVVFVPGVTEVEIRGRKDGAE